MGTDTASTSPPLGGGGGALDYRLPPELIAQQPAARRDDARLLVVHRETGRLEDRGIADLPEYLGQDYVVVANDSKVFPARVLGFKRSGGKVEFLLTSRQPQDGGVPAMFRSSKGLREGQEIVLGSGRVLRILGPVESGRCRLDFGELDIAATLDEDGQIPLPPYIRRPDGPVPSDLERYQTVYARDRGSVAAPTAGLHLTDALIGRLVAGGASFQTITLHVGPGTFLPVRGDLDDHVMEPERWEVSPAAAKAISEARASGRRLAAIGTTTVRALESIALENLAAKDRGSAGGVVAGSGDANLFIRPGFRFRLVDVLLTNFHLPGSTLLALIMALAGEDLVRSAYEHAVSERYRFYSYGDAMLIL